MSNTPHLAQSGEPDDKIDPPPRPVFPPGQGADYDTPPEFEREVFYTPIQIEREQSGAA
jgi:hypothetical protein